MVYRVARGIALEPFRMRLHRIFPVQVRTHARDHVQAALLGGGAAVAEEIPLAEKLAFAMEWHFGLVKSEYAGDAHHRGVHFQAGPVIGPLLDVQHHGIVLRHIELAQTANLSLPGNLLGRGH